jgi:hypothetical protein
MSLKEFFLPFGDSIISNIIFYMIFFAVASRLIPLFIFNYYLYFIT